MAYLNQREATDTNWLR